MSKKQEIPDIQRALVLQGSVALGAFEAGVFKKLYEKIRAQDPRWEKRMFDIVVGTSAGAINAAILVSHFKQNKTWEGSADKLVEYWKEHLSSPTPVITKLGIDCWNQYYRIWGKYYDLYHNNDVSNNNNFIMTSIEETARRYYSTKYFFTYGAPNVFSPAIPFPELDSKFYDNNPLFPPANLWLRYNNKPLRNTLTQYDSKGKEFVKFRLVTSFDNEEPRFLAVSVDVQYGKAVTFDSYSKVSVFQAYDSQTREYKDLKINYPDGINVEHVMASASFPVYFDYEEVDGRKFWDGGILSNTPLRELLQAHRDYWLKDRKSDKVPNLEVYIIDVWPSEENVIPTDYDGVKNRKSDIADGDQTEYDQKVAFLVTDYLTLYNKTKEIAIENLKDQKAKDKFLQDLEGFLISTKGRSTSRSGDQRNFKDLLNGRFEIKKVVTIERKNDPNVISNKWADYTLETITSLISEGEEFEKRAVVKIMPPEKKDHLI